MFDKETIMKKAHYWATNEYFDAETRAEIQALLDQNNEKEIIDRYYQDLEFGTGGLRGTLGAGINRMNRYTVRRATQGLANYLLKQFSGRDQLSVSISFDNRHFSTEFSEESAAVLAANGIKTHLFKELNPTPILSFSVRKLGAQAGIMITASHNPPEYNGYKVYWEDGAQVVPPHDSGIIDEVQKITDYNQINFIPFDQAIEKGLVEYVGQDLFDSYYKKIKDLYYQKEIDHDLKLVYTPLHGAGFKPSIQVLKDRGFTNIMTVEEQNIPDPEFPTVKSPNPENSEALEMAVDYAKKNGAELVLATDPDSDRMAAVGKHEEEFIYFNGNQCSALLAYYIFHSLKNENRLPENPVLVKTIVTSDLQTKIAEHYHAECIEVLTGFKWIAEQQKIIEENFKGKKTYVFGSEESYGYLAGDFVRDKDGVQAVALIAEMAAYYKKNGKSLLDVMYQIYEQFGYYLESLVNIQFPGADGQAKMKAIMQSLRDNPPKEFLNSKVVEIRDISIPEKKDLTSGVATPLNLPKSNVLAFILKDGSKISARPSGTEPKIKFYFSVNIQEKLPIKEKEAMAHEKLKKLEKEFLQLVS